MAYPVGAQTGQLGEMRLTVQLALRQIPQPGEGDIVHDQPPIRPKNGDSFVQRVEGGGDALEVKAPRVGLYKSWIASLDEGWMRFVFDTNGVPYKTLVNADR